MKTGLFQRFINYIRSTSRKESLSKEINETIFREDFEEDFLEVLVRKTEEEYKLEIAIQDYISKNGDINSSEKILENIEDLAERLLRTNIVLTGYLQDLQDHEISVVEFMTKIGYHIDKREFPTKTMPKTGIMISRQVGKIIKKEERTNWFDQEYELRIIRTEGENIKGINHFEDYVGIGSLYSSLTSIEGRSTCVINETSLKKSVEENLNFSELFIFYKNVIDKSELNLTQNRSFRDTMGLRFVLPCLESASQLEGNQEKIFIENCMNEILESKISIISSQLGNHIEDPIKKTIHGYLTHLNKQPSFYTFMSLDGSQNPRSIESLALKDSIAANEIFRLFNEKGYTKDRIKTANLNEISEVAKDIYKDF